MDSFSEAEIQVLIALVELSHPKETPNNNFYTFYPKTLEEAATYFRGFRTDWTAAFASLIGRELVIRTGSNDQLTAAGVVQAQQLREARPPIFYWYEEFYTEAPRSPAFAQHCERLYGKALCQEGFSDMAQIDTLLRVAEIGPHHRVLDLGCGTGHIAEYIAEATGAQVAGMDYSPAAMAEAQTRTASKRDRLSFSVGNLDHLDYPPASFDTLVSIDTLYMPNDLDSTLAQMRALLKPGGKMAIFFGEMIGEPSASREVLEADHTPLGRVLRQAGLAYQTWDFSAEHHRLMQRKHQIAASLRDEFAAEGRAFLYDHLLTESWEGTAPYDPDTRTASRYLYLV
jgi:ubiquinone/menaquinone biosynthesis C-methylase UbiE